MRFFFFCKTQLKLSSFKRKRNRLNVLRKKESLPRFNHRLPCHSRAFNSFSRETLLIKQHDCCVGLVLASLDEKKSSSSAWLQWRPRMFFLSTFKVGRAADVGTTRRRFGQSSCRRTFISVASAPPLRDQQVQQMVCGESLEEKTFHFRVTVFVQS